MQSNTFQQISVAGLACAALLLAADPWKKDSSEWSSDDIHKVLNDSPWAKQMNVSPEGRRQGPGGRRGGGYGGRGGIGFPGGGYPGGGGGYPGGGGGGGGYPGGAQSQQIVLRWESAAPVQQALKRQGVHTEDDSKQTQGSKPAVDINQKYYVVAILGLQLPNPNRGRYGDSSGNDDSNSQSNKNSDDDLRSRLLDAGQLVPKDGAAIAADDVKFEGRNGSIAIRYLFPRTFPLQASDKEVVFHFQSNGIKFDHKFKLGEMVYQGQLAL